MYVSVAYWMAKIFAKKLMGSFTELNWIYLLEWRNQFWGKCVGSISAGFMRQSFVSTRERPLFVGVWDYFPRSSWWSNFGYKRFELNFHEASRRKFRYEENAGLSVFLYKCALSVKRLQLNRLLKIQWTTNKNKSTILSRNVLSNELSWNDYHGYV